MNRTQVRAKLMDASSNKLVWKNEAQYNDLPKAADDKFTEMMSLLYSTIAK
jgi:hypothetical protein